MSSAARRPLCTSAILLLGLSQLHTANAFVSPQKSTYVLQTSWTTPNLPSSSRNTKQSSNTRLGLTGLEGGGLEELWNSYLMALETNPLLVKSVTAGVLLGAADLAGQSIQRAIAKSEEGSTASSSGVDIARFLRFAFFGFILQAPWNHYYYMLLDGTLPPTEDPFTATTGIKVVIDQFVQAPIFTVIIFGFLGVLEGKTLDDIKKQLDEDYVDTMLANWKLWVPATVVNIAFCPPILRVLFLNVVFFFWSIFLSLKLNKKEDAVKMD
jgi:peroxisomal membrane protein 2